MRIYLALNNQYTVHMKSVKISNLNENRALIISNVTYSITIIYVLLAQKKPKKVMVVGAFFNAKMKKSPTI